MTFIIIKMGLRRNQWYEVLSSHSPRVVIIGGQASRSMPPLRLASQAGTPNGQDLQLPLSARQRFQLYGRQHQILHACLIARRDVQEPPGQHRALAVLTRLTPAAHEFQSGPNHIPFQPVTLLTHPFGGRLWWEWPAVLVDGLRFCIIVTVT